MSITLNGSTGLSGPDGTAGTPALRGSDTNTGISFGSDVILASTGGTERWRVDSSGRLLVGTSTATANGGILELTSGITFPATDVAASNVNTLDDYEEGTWTPQLISGGSNITAFGGSYTTQSGTYTKIGNRAIISAYIKLANKGSNPSTLWVEGLPLSAANNQSAYVSLGVLASPVIAGGVFSTGPTRLQIRNVSAADTDTTNVNNSQLSNTSSIYIFASYLTA